MSNYYIYIVEQSIKTFSAIGNNQDCRFEFIEKGQNPALEILSDGDKIVGFITNDKKKFSYVFDIAKDSAGKLHMIKNYEVSDGPTIKEVSGDIKTLILANEQSKSFIAITESQFNELVSLMTKTAATNLDITDSYQVVNYIDDVDYSIKELGMKLKDMYDSAQEGFQVASIHVFGIKYGKFIIEKKYKATEIIKAALLNDSYATELSKAIKIFDCFSTNKYGIKIIDEKGYLIGKESDGIRKNGAKNFQFNDLPDTFKTDYSKRYITSLLTKPFVILTGNSGIGKTRIAKHFSQYLERVIDGKRNWLIVPVGADWTDNTKMLGFYNPLEEKYVSTPTLDFILQSDKNPEVPYFLILDEMNLSHVERYFSDFLSAMESDEEIPLYKLSKDKEVSGEHEEEIPEKIRLPKNLFVTGTVNIDETTYMFSPKVLDRSNVIEFKPEKEDVLNIMTDAADVNMVSIAEFGVAEGFTDLALSVRNGVCDVDSTVIEKVKVFLESIYDDLQEGGFEFAYRTVKEIRQYFAAAYELQKEDFNLVRTMDEQIVQKILPKIYGDRKQIGELLDSLQEKCHNGIEDNSSEEMTLSLKKIEQMKKRLDKYQYASFM